LYDISSKQQERIQDSSVSTVTRLHAGLKNLGLILRKERDFTLIHIDDIDRLAHAMFYQWMPKALSPGMGVKRNRRLYIEGKWCVGLSGTGRAVLLTRQRHTDIVAQ